MDLTARKNKFIEQFMKIVSVEKLERFEEFLRVETNDNKNIVAHTIKGKPLTQDQYIKNNNDAVTSYKKGNFLTTTQIKEKYRVK